ncbi:DNA topoisomerase I [Denitrovibrio acetiphilus DSM 12809]|uniref:DNA topoisomerase 1 n=1 Tax=Denitrovibrio acetiphilus (strain DSM 12809 / NBRC 114555 / N2460) TaxID=522772 RepID=D4H5K9_DENA2|nr:type I DNA topoisomerase [Denitrovibrio acetiphilus]ADD67629.1 DNA topoisomerase I [Denitrovibrio acetiphilus DSM 12809]
MPKNLVIVESPAKARTIEKYLGRNFKVLASVGHVKDLPASSLGVDLDNDFEPKYSIIRGKKKIIDELKKVANSAENIYLAPDPDREGEAIAWHIAEELGKKNKGKIYRVLFNEITKKGIEDGIKNTGPINENRTNAQQARRILDRLVGYLVSPLLWKSLKYGLSAGRVQSVALRLLVEREEEIEKFKPEEYWLIDVTFKGGQKALLKARLEKKNGKKYRVPNGEEAEAVLAALKAGSYNVNEVIRKEVFERAPLPFITSKLQQEAARKLSFSAKRTMMLAQRLYEGIELGSEGPVGLITYMRTDSTRVSPDATNEARGYIEKQYGKEFLSKGVKGGSKKKNVQDAHEAIRPTSVAITPESVKKILDTDQYKLYKLIWDRFVSSNMADAVYDQNTIHIANGPYLLKSQGKVMKFPGFQTLYIEGVDESKEKDQEVIFDVKEGETLNPEKHDSKQMFTQPPARYSEATLVKTLEAEGIGRPSTYASIISTLIDREYANMEEKRFKPTELGRVVCSLLIANFDRIFEPKFTAGMEEDLDSVEAGELTWKGVLRDFYAKFKPELEKAEKQFSANLKIEMKCPVCEKDLTIKYGRNGNFVACTSYPECKFTSNYERLEDGSFKLVPKEEDKPSGIECEKCGKELVFKKTRFGEVLACPGYPECKNIKNYVTLPDGEIKILAAGEEIGTPCPKCEAGLTIKGGRNGMFIGCKNYPDCDFTANMEVNEQGDIIPKYDKVDENVKCEKCGKPMVLKKSRRGKFFACTGYPECKNAKSTIVLEDGTISVKE